MSTNSATELQRADELLRQMTIEEKAMQLSCAMPLAFLDRDGLMRGQADRLIKQGIGHVAGIGLLGHKAPETIAKSINAIQRYLLTETRLKIPAIFHNEARPGISDEAPRAVDPEAAMAKRPDRGRPRSVAT